MHLYLARAKHFGRQFVSENQRFTAEMLRPYEYIAILNHSYISVGAVPPCPPSSEELGNHGGIAPTRIMQMI